MQASVPGDTACKSDRVPPRELGPGAVSLHALEKTYTGGCCCTKGFRAVRGVTTQMTEGSVFCLLGHNGAGKTTTLSMLTGIVSPTSGDADVFGHSISGGQASMRHIRSITGVCPQVPCVMVLGMVVRFCTRNQ